MFRTSILLHWLTCLFYANFKIFFITVIMQYHLKSEMVPPMVLLLFRIVLDILGVLKFKIFFIFLWRIVLEFWWGVHCLLPAFRRLAFYTLLTIPIHEHRRSFNVFLPLPLRAGIKGMHHHLPDVFRIFVYKLNCLKIKADCLPFFLFVPPFISFSCLFALAQTSKYHIEKTRREYAHTNLVPGFSGNILSSSF